MTTHDADEFSFASTFGIDPGLREAAEVAVRGSLKIQPGEKVIIITNPARDVAEISYALFDTSIASGARASIIIQRVKTQMDYAEESVIAAFESQPDVVMSLSAEKLGKDRSGLRTPYDWDDVSYDHIFHYQLHGAKTLRAFWSPSVTKAMFVKTVPIDYAELKRRCLAVRKLLEHAVSVRVRSQGGTDIVVGLRGRVAMSDDGDFSSPGRGGNLPAGEVFVSPELGSSNGVIVFDGSVSLDSGDIVVSEPVRAVVRDGFFVSFEGGPDARRLEQAVASGSDNARAMADDGRITKDKAVAYARNARNVGELGIGLNPKAVISGNMLEDEKAFGTCHFAIGSNYDEDAPALIHYDCLVKRPTIVAVLEDGREAVIEEDGELRA
ncbi:MAG: aminopeptidase [Spirochaetes bacterium]|nr:aminopeptidase [Spirochaetota bacterium]